MEQLELLHRMVWGPWTLGIFLGTGLFFTVKCRCFQLRGFGFWWGATVGKLLKKKDGVARQPNPSQKTASISQFQSVCTALAATVGTGNIVGVATALTAGGAGALFWMWVSAVIGMITAYAETMLGISYRVRREDGRYLSGPFLYMERGLGLPRLGILYAFFCLLSSFGMGSMVQAHSAVSTMVFTWSIPALAAGIGFTAILGVVIWGGISRIGSVAEKLMPVASGIYLVFSLIIIISCYDRLPGILRAVCQSAFDWRAAAGGTAGYGICRSIRYGMSRGVFSNEAGLGTLAVLHGPAENTTACEQGMWAMFEVFFDTVVLCSLTALVILCMAGTEPGGMPLDGAALAAWSFGRRLGPMGEYLVSASLVIFAFATIMAWFYLGKQAAEYLGWGVIVRGYPLLFLTAVFLGGHVRLEMVWLLSDIWNGLMAFPNLTALLFLSSEVVLPSGYRKSS